MESPVAGGVNGQQSKSVLYYGLLLFFFLEYIRPGKSLPFLDVLRLGTILPLVLFVLTFLTNRRVSNQDVLRSHNSKWLIFFLGLIVISIATADVTFYAYRAFKGVVGWVIIYFILAKEVDTVGRMKGVFFTLSVLHIIVMALTPDILLNPESRPYLAYGVFLGDGNDFALSVSIALPLCFFLYLDEKSRILKIAYLAACVLLVLGIIGTSSRGGSLALFASILYLWSRSRKKLLGILAAVLLAGIAVSFAPASYFDRLGTIKEYEEDSSAKYRIVAWKSGMRMAIAHPLLGVGVGHFPVKFGTEFRPPEYGPVGGAWITAHSCYFLILGELGFPGIIFLLSIIVANFFLFEKNARQLARLDTNTAMRMRRLLICLNSGLIGFAVGGAFLSAVYYPHLYVIAGLFTSAQGIFLRVIQDSQGLTVQPVVAARSNGW